MINSVRKPALPVPRKAEVRLITSARAAAMHLPVQKFDLN